MELFQIQCKKWNHVWRILELKEKIIEAIKLYTYITMNPI